MKDKPIDKVTHPKWKSSFSTCEFWSPVYKKYCLFKIYCCYSSPTLLPITAVTTISHGTNRAGMFIFYFLILLEYSCFTMLCEFQVDSKVSQLYTYMYSAFFRFFPMWVITEYGVESLWLSILYTVVCVFIPSSKFTHTLPCPQPVHPEGDQSWVFIGRTDAETPILWPLHAKSWLIGKDPDAGRDLGAEGEGDDRGWDGWMASLTRWTWVWVNSGSWWWTGRPGVLQFMGSQRVGHDWVTELNYPLP